MSEIKLEARKDGNGNILISEDSFEMLLNCLDNQKFISESPVNGDSISMEVDYNDCKINDQYTIDQFNKLCREVLCQKYVIDSSHGGLVLHKRYERQGALIPWSVEDVDKVYSLFTNVDKPLIERTLYSDYDYLTISDDGLNNRIWSDDEISKIEKLFNR